MRSSISRVGRGPVFEREERVRRAEVVREKKAGARGGAIGGGGPPLQVGAPPFLEEPQEVTSKPVHGHGLEHGGSMARATGPTRRFTSADSGIPAFAMLSAARNRSSRSRDRRNQEADEVLLPEVREMAPGEEGELQRRPDPQERSLAEARRGGTPGTISTVPA